ncbi:MAG: CRISPR-associated helicase Cas3' [Gemmatimonadetes bacterium]|nr:CRISPR-associated helicase Cas3' [Gemmatimonadota bacterium]
MRGVPRSFWGKLDTDQKSGEVTEWHPLIDHCADVAACAEALLCLPTWRRRLARLCGRADLDDVTCARLAVLAALHDLGKFNLGFQAKGRADLGATAGHVKEALSLIGEGPDSPVAGRVVRHVDPIGNWGEGATGLLVASICHHGRPYSYEHAPPFEAALWSPREGLVPGDGVRTLVAACHEWFPRAFEEGAPALPHEPRFEHAYAGLVMLADWLGSDSTVFRFSADADEGRMAFARIAARQFVGDSWLSIDSSRRSDRAREAPFTRIADRAFVPHHTQLAMLELPVDEGGSVTILESETGSGKTEAALARFLTLFSAGEVDGMYFALPTRTAATQMYQRVLSAMQRGFTSPPPVVLAVPGYFRVDDIKGERKLASFEVLWPDANSDRFRYRAWAGEGPKRYLAGCVVVGTIDQVLLSSLMVGHAHLRATALLRQFLVVDEVHASDAYMTEILEDVLERHIGAGGHALLLSATLGSETRTRLLQPHAPTTPPSLNEAKSAPYPLVSHRGDRELPMSLVRDGTRRTVTIEAAPWLESPETVAATAIQAARDGARVLIVKNTVADCIEVQQRLEATASAAGDTELLFHCIGAAAPHHSRFARPDREALDRALEAAFGKSRPAGGCVVVATQTVQQSLDLDADLMLTDLCPMDVLLQRIGRLHRHTARPRPSGFKEARAIILVPSERNLGLLLNERGKARHHHGLGTVYPDLRVLEATWRLIEHGSRWEIPGMSRALVEGSLHSESLGVIAAAGGARWEAHAQAMIGARRGETRQADLNVIDRARPYSETTFPDSKDERILTRLGEGDRRVRFLNGFEGPFGLSVAELTFPGRWAPGVPPDVEYAEAVATADRTTEFAFGGWKFVYDRHGLRRAKPTKREAASSDDDGP